MEKLYKALFKSGDYTKSFEEFVEQFGDNKKSERLYKALNEVGDYTKSFEEFNEQFGFNDSVKKKRLFSITWHCSRGRYGINYRRSGGGSASTRWFFGFWRKTS